MSVQGTENGGAAILLGRNGGSLRQEGLGWGVPVGLCRTLHLDELAGGHFGSHDFLKAPFAPFPGDCGKRLWSTPFPPAPHPGLLSPSSRDPERTIPVLRWFLSPCLCRPRWRKAWMSPAIPGRSLCPGVADGGGALERSSCLSGRAAPAGSEGAGRAPRAQGGPPTPYCSQRPRSVPGPSVHACARQPYL